MIRTVIFGAVLLYGAGAAAQTTLALGETASGETTDAAQQDAFTFEAQPGQRVFVERLATSNYYKLNWQMTDRFGRVLTQNLSELGHLGPLPLMGGPVTVTVTSEGGGLGTYAFVVHEVVDIDGTLSLGQDVEGAITVPGQRARHAFSVATPTRVFLNHLASNNGSSLNYAVEDSHGNALLPFETSLNDAGPVVLPAGDYHLVVRGETNAVGTYRAQIAKAPRQPPVAITLGQVFQGEITVPGEERVFTFDMPTSGRLFVDVTATSNTSGLNHRLELPTGAAPHGWTTLLDDRGPYDTVAGPHTLRVRSEGQGTGTFSIRVVTPNTVTTPITIGQPVTGSLDTPGQVAVYTFDATGGERVVFDGQGSSNFYALNWGLETADGRVLRSRTNAFDDSDPMTLAPGGYRLFITQEGDNTGDYAFEIALVTDLDQAASIGDVVSGTLANGQEDRWHFTAPPGRIGIEYVSSSNFYRLNYELVDALGRVVVSRTSALDSTTPISLLGGNYTLRVLGETGYSGSYELRIADEGPPTYTAPDALPLTLGEPLIATIVAGQADTYALDLAADTTVFFDLLQGANGLEWTLTDPVGRTLFSGARARYESDDRGRYPLKAGSYRLRVEHPGGGTPEYRFTAHAVTDTTGAVALDGEPAAASTTIPGETHTVSFTLTDPTRVYLDLLTAGSDLEWTLTDPWGQPVFSAARARYPDSDDRGPYTLPPGDYQLVFDPTGDAVRTFSFALRSVTDTHATAALGDTVVFDGAGPGAVHRVDFSLDAPTRLYLDVLTGTNDLFWSLVRVEGDAEVAIFDGYEARYAYHDRGSYELPAGDYRLVFDPASDILGHAEVVLLQTDVGITPIALGQAVTGTLASPGHVQRYAFTLAAPTAIFYDTTDPSTNLYATLTDEAGHTRFSGYHLNQSGDDWGPRTLPAGDYQLELTSDGQPTGQFGFVFRALSNPDGGPVVLDKLTGVAIDTPGDTARFTVSPEADGQALAFDVMSSAPSGFRWTLLDSVGWPVFEGVAAWTWSNHDRGPFTLAAGAYTLIFDPDGDLTAGQQFRVVADSVLTAAPKGCAKCSALDVAFVFDTSGSMDDNASEMCALAADLVSGLGQQGIPVQATFWGISQLSTVPCITTTVLDELGGEVPLPPTDDFAVLNQCTDGGAGEVENWAPAAAILAERYPWSADAVRLVVPVADEGPYCGDPLNGLDAQAIDHASLIAAGKSVVISPIVPDDVGDPLRVEAIRLAEGTGGTALVADFQPEALLPAVAALAQAACSTETEAARPTLEAVEPGSHLVLPAGVPVILSGRVAPVNALRPVIDVRIDGQPVESLDASGRFFHPVILQPGENVLPVAAIEGCGSFQYSVTLTAEPEGSSGADDYVSAPGLDWVSRDTTWNPGLQTLFAQAAVVSDAPFPLDGPILMVLGPDRDPQLTLTNADGTLPDGRPYRIVVEAGGRLDPGATGPWVDLALENPARRPLRHSVNFLTPENRAPVLTSAPPTSARPGKTWTYAATAYDADGHALTWTLLTAPAGVSHTAGALSWTPGEADLGNHDLALKVDDGRGGSAVQRFTVAVGGNPGNTPPLFVSAALTHAPVGADYLYDADATDLDGDVVTFSLSAGPSGMTVDPDTGVISWSFAVPGHHPVTLVASDGQGGQAQQTWTLTVGELPQNPHTPIITSSPPLLAVAGAPWLYVLLATDPDGDSLSYSVEVGPADLQISPAGVLSWSPQTADLGPHPVTVSVSDGFGGVATQSFNLQVLDSLPDQAPRFVSSPALTAVAGAAYTYAPVVVDPEGLTPTVDLISPPAGAAFVDGVLTWTPPEGTQGLVGLALRATDPEGNVGHQAWLVDVRSTNAPPALAGGIPPVWTLAAGKPWAYAPASFDADGDPLTLGLVGAPPGMTVDAGGVVRWTPTPAQAGTWVVTLVLSDPFGGESQVQLTLEVVHDGKPPTVDLVTTPQKACLNKKFQACVMASDDTGVTARTLTVGGAPVALPGGVCAFVPVVGEVLSLAATASDAAGNVGTASALVPVIDCENDPAPEVTIVSPTPNGLLDGPVEIHATITDNSPQDLSWTVEVAPDGTDDWTVIGAGQGEADGLVAHLDTTLRENGTWRLRIVGNDGIQTGGLETWYGITGDYKLGNFRLSFTDARVAVGGIPLTVTRHYDSLNRRQGDFGVGWRMSLSAEVRDSAKESNDPKQFAFINMLLTEPYTATTRVEVTRPDGQRVGFTFAPEVKGFPTPFLVTPKFEPDPGVEDKLDFLPADKQGVFNFGGVFKAYIVPFNPSVFLFTTKEGVVYTISETTGLTHVKDVAGNTLQVTDAGVVSSLGPELTFERDAKGRITRLILPEAEPGEVPVEVRYTYDAVGNLGGVTDPDGHTTTLRYESPVFPHYLTGIDDPLGRPSIRTVFDDDGRLIAACPAGGDPVTRQGCQEWQHDAVAGTSTYVDTNGNRLDRFMDDRGNVVVERRWLDDTEWLDQVYVYNEHNKVVQRTDPAGNTWSYTFDARGRQTSVTDPSGERTWTVTWDTVCNEHAQECDPLGNCTHYVYDAKCRVVSMTDALGGTTTFGYSAAGNLTSVTDAADQTWTFGYNGLGLQTQRTDPLGNVELVGYDGRGRVVSRVDRDGHQFSYQRDKSGRVVQETWHGQPEVSATMTYNAAGQLTEVEGPNATITVEYTATGHVQSLYTDAAGSPPSQVTYSIDGNANVTRVVDSAGGVTDWTYDALNRLVTATQTGGADKRVELQYNAASQLTSMTRFTDLAGTEPAVVSTFGFDCGGCPTRLNAIEHRRASDDSVIHALTMTRDAIGQITALTDAEGAHTYTWDGRHRLLAATHPGGDSESYTYDGVGNRLSSHLSASYSYSGHRLTEDDTWTYAYDKRGNLTEQTDKATGARRVFEWDRAGRLTGVQAYDAGGALTDEVEHVYAWGGRRLRSVIGGQAYHYVYDRTNPLLVLDDAGAVLSRRLYGNVTDRVLAEERDGALRWLLVDHVGSVRDVVSADGNTVLQHHTLDSFGRDLSGGSPDPLDLSFTARDRDPVSGLAYHRDRWYDPARGRFVSEDPERPWRYDYAENSPLQLTDPSGRVASIEYRILLFTIVCDVASAVSAGKGFAMTIYALFKKIEVALESVAAGNPVDPGHPMDGVPPPINEWSWLPCGLGELPPLLGM